MANSSIDLVSNALLLVGDEPISSFDEPGAGAQAGANLYQDVKEAALSFHPWSFAMKQQVLSQLSETPDPLTGLKFAYTTPTDAIRIWEIMPHNYYEIVGSVIYSNEPRLLMRYVYDVVVSQMPAHFVKALEYQLAAEFAISITEDEGKAQLYEKKARDQLAKASNIDSQGRPQQAITDSPFIKARVSGSNYTGFGRGFG